MTEVDILVVISGGSSKRFCKLYSCVSDDYVGDGFWKLRKVLEVVFLYRLRCS